MRFSRLAAAGAVVCCALSSGACAKLHAGTIGPPLETPAPPPRVVPSAAALPIESQPIVAAPIGEVQAPTPDRIPAATSRPADVAAPPAPAPVPTPAPPAPALQTTANPAAAERRTREALANAARNLGRIDLRALSADAKAQYDIARRFIAQANDALNARNVEFAQQLADKAETLAALLQQR